jgi:KDZ transposase family protein
LSIVEQQGPDELKQLLSFIHYASRLKNEILLAQPSTQNTQIAPLDLPDAIEIFLAAVCDMLLEDVADCWSVVRDLIWDMETLDDKAVSRSFEEHSINTGLREFEINLDLGGLNINLASPRNLFPPSHMCKNSNCTRSNNKRKLQTVKQRQGVFYTLKGPVPIYSAFLTCQGVLLIELLVANANCFSQIVVHHIILTIMSKVTSGSTTTISLMFFK